MTDRLGFWSASGLVIIGVAYAVAVGFGMAAAGLTKPILDPALAAMEVITLVAAPLIVILMAAIYGYAQADRKALALIALSFGVLAAGVTAGVHFVTLTAGRQSGFTALEWPSTLYALELLAWDVFLGLSLLFAAPVFVGSGFLAVARRLVALTGALSLAGAAGPIVGDMAIQRIGILGYGVLLPIASFFLALVFRRNAQSRLSCRPDDCGLEPRLQTSPISAICGCVANRTSASEFPDVSNRPLGALHQRGRRRHRCSHAVRHHARARDTHAPYSLQFTNLTGQAE